jgi:hypothetical protein
MTNEQLTFSEDEGRRMGLSVALTKTLRSLRSVDAVPAPQRCPALASDESECDGTTHWLAQPVRMSAVRRCQLERYRSERKRLVAQLALCGYQPSWDSIEDPVAPTLRNLLAADRHVEGLAGLLRALDALMRRGPAAAGHVHLEGTVGTAKTHALLVLYFLVLWGGRSAAWLTSSEVRAVAAALRSFDEERVAAAGSRLMSWQRCQVLVLDDLGDQLSDVRARSAGSTPMSALLQDLLNGTRARLFWSSNLDERQLVDHPDFGLRVVDRLTADHQGMQRIHVKLDGPSQRHAAAREVG